MLLKIELTVHGYVKNKVINPATITHYKSTNNIKQNECIIYKYLLYLEDVLVSSHDIALGCWRKNTIIMIMINHDLL